MSMQESSRYDDHLISSASEHCFAIRFSDELRAEINVGSSHDAFLCDADLRIRPLLPLPAQHTASAAAAQLG